jgi:hypothetical protein
MPTATPRSAALQFLAELHARADRRKEIDTQTQGEWRQSLRMLGRSRDDLIRRYGDAAKAEFSTFTGDWGGAQFQASKQLGHHIPDEFLPVYVAEIANNLHALPANPVRAAYEYWLLGVHLQIIRYVASKLFDHCPIPLFDTLRVGHVNALIRRFDDEVVLVFQSGTKAFTNLFCKTFVRIWLETAQIVHDRNMKAITHDQEREILSGNAAVEQLRQIFHSYLFLGDPIAGMFVDPQDRINQIASEFETAMDRFIIAHEYAHILLGHLPRDNFKDRQAQELEADGNGILLLLASWTNEGSDLVLPFCAAQITLAVQHLIMSTIYAIKNQTEALKNYPSIVERQNNLVSACRQVGILSPQMQSTAEGLVDTLKILYALIEPTLLVVARNGRPLASIW